ncbi:hypothetical protein SLEP1_g39076 [Rubroshorea leprosula]|uniref:Uncharacterized protein n=2 Tax=Rubroshorea leprosula TaxID=152421 RepID=A0AAV5KZH4_9ROSI|nr:hypothetical protein SLEP1_g39076 [Rubroshorea leprosula]
MGFSDLFIVALMPVLEVLLVTALGLFLALDRVDLLGPESRHRLNNIVFYVFGPAIVFSNLAETITFQKLVSLWFMPVNILLTFIIGSALAWLLIKITKTPLHLQGLVIGCCSAGNLGNLLLIIIPAVCKESNSPFGDSSYCSVDGEAYASLSMAVGVIYIWSYVYNIMRVFAVKITDKHVDDSTVSINISVEDTETSSKSCKEPLLPSGDNCHPDHFEKPGTSSGVKTKKIPIWTIQRIKKIATDLNLKMIFAPATIASIVGFVIGTVSPIRKLMIGDGAPLRCLGSSVSLLGEALIPCMTLIVGANLLQGLKRSGVGFVLIIGIIVVRYILLPLLGIGVVKAASHFGLIGSDSLYKFVLMLQYALPPAMAVGTISQLFNAGQSECSVLMLWTYAVASFFLTFWSTIYMWLLT